MAFTLSQLNSQLDGLQSRLSTEGITKSIRAATDALIASTTTKLGLDVGSVIGGFESLTQTVDNPNGSTETRNVGIARLTDQVPGLRGALVTEISGGNSSKLNTLIGTASTAIKQAEGGLLNVVIAANTPKAISDAMHQVTGLLPSQLTRVFDAVGVGEISTALQGLADNSLFKQVMAATTEFQGAIDTALGGLATTGVLSAVIERFTGQIYNGIQSVVDIDTNSVIKAGMAAIIDSRPDDASDVLVKLLTVPESLTSIHNVRPLNNNSVRKLQRWLTSVSTHRAAKPSDVAAVRQKISVLQAKVVELSSGWHTQVDRSDVELGGPSPQSCVAIGGLGGGQSTSPSSTRPQSSTQSSSALDTDFSFIDSYDEAVADLRAITREVTTVIVHWTANYIDDSSIDAAAVKRTHVARGWNTVGYHYIIKRDGTLQRARSPNVIGAHAKSAHNPYSLGISMVGGYNCPNGTPSPESHVSAASINPSQWASLDLFLKAFYTIFPGGEVWGHNDVDPRNKIDPGIDVPNYISAKFGKVNASTQPSRTYSTGELANLASE